MLLLLEGRNGDRVNQWVWLLLSSLVLLLLLLLLVSPRHESQLLSEQFGRRAVLSGGHAEHQVGLLLLLLLVREHHVAHLLLDRARQNVVDAEGQLVLIVARLLGWRGRLLAQVMRLLLRLVQSEGQVFLLGPKMVS